MRNLILILIAATLLSSCSSLKNHYLKKYCKQDTIRLETTIHDTIIVDSVQVDTVFNQNIDSIFIEKDKIQIQYIKKFGKVYLQGKCKADTIFYEKKIFLKVPYNCPEIPKPTFLQNTWSWIIKSFAFFGVAAFLFVLFTVLKRSP